MNRKAFHQLLRKYLDGTCTPQERALVEQWYELLDDDSLQEQDAERLPLIEDRIWQKIQAGIALPPTDFHPVKKQLQKPSVFKWMAAALIIILAGTGVYVIQSHPRSNPFLKARYQPQDGQLYTNNNSGKTILTVVLEDSSEVQLQPGASLSYPPHFSITRREVYLDGAAFFNVQKNPARPFLVYTRNLITQVLGTRFTITTAKNQCEVAVLSGKVAVYEEIHQSLHSKGGVVVLPNEKVTYYANNHHFITSLVDNPVAVNHSRDSIPSTGVFSFDETPVAQILEQLENTYLVQIIAENENINHCLFSGNISGLSLFGMLDLICGAIGADYEIRGTSILITGNGCD